MKKKIMVVGTALSLMLGAAACSSEVNMKEYTSDLGYTVKLDDEGSPDVSGVDKASEVKEYSSKLLREGSGDNISADDLLVMDFMIMPIGDALPSYTSFKAEGVDPSAEAQPIWGELSGQEFGKSVREAVSEENRVGDVILIESPAGYNDEDSTVPLEITPELNDDDSVLPSDSAGSKSEEDPERVPLRLETEDSGAELDEEFVDNGDVVILRIIDSYSKAEFKDLEMDLEEVPDGVDIKNGEDGFPQVTLDSDFTFKNEAVQVIVLKEGSGEPVGSGMIPVSSLTSYPGQSTSYAEGNDYSFFLPAKAEEDLNLPDDISNYKAGSRLLFLYPADPPEGFEDPEPYDYTSATVVDLLGTERSDMLPDSY